MSSTILINLFSPNPAHKNLPIRTLNYHVTAPPPLRSACPSIKFIATPIKLERNFSAYFLGVLKNQKKLGFVLKAQYENNADMDMSLKEEALLRGESSMPDRFRPLTKEAPDKPIRWPWFIALGFLLYAWRTVLWELSNWKKGGVVIFKFVGYISKVVLAMILHFLGDPITSLIRGVETTLYALRASYSWLIAYAPMKELMVLIVLASVVLSIAEATVPDSVNSQPYLLTIAGVIGYAAVRGYISELLFWTLLVGIFGFSRLVKKRDFVSSALPVAVVLAAMGEPWVRLAAMASFLALAISQYSKNTSKVEQLEATAVVEKIPVPLLFAAMAIGIRLAAKWAGYRHLTWMIV